MKAASHLSRIFGIPTSFALMALSWNSQATPYASGIRLNGTTVSFILNESADSVAIATNSPLDGTAGTNVLGALAKGAYSFDLTGATNYSILVFKNSGPGWRTHLNYVTNIIGTTVEKRAVELQISDNLSSNVVFNSARGLAINKNAASPYFGRVYVANSAASTVPFTNNPATLGPLGYRINGVGDGIYVLNGDLSDAFGEGTPRTAGLTTPFGANGSTPYRMVVGADDNLFICGQGATNAANLWMTDPDVSPGSGTNVFMLMSNTPTAGTFPIGADNNHGGLEAVWVTGTLGAGTAYFYFIDQDAQDDKTTLTKNQLNSLWNNKGPFQTGNGYADLPITTAMNHPWTPASKFNTAPRVTDIDRGGPLDIWYMTMFVDDGDPIRAYSAAGFGSVYTSPGKETPYTIALAPDPTSYSYAAVGKRSDGCVWIYPVDSLGALRDTRRSLLWSSGVYPGGYASGGSYRVRQVRFDAAFNLYVLEDNMPLRVYSPGGASLATTFGDTNSATSSGFTVQFGPAITAQATTAIAGSPTGAANTNIVLTAGVSGTLTVQGDYISGGLLPAFTKQWYKDGVALPNNDPDHIIAAQSASMTLIPRTCAADSGLYYFVAANEIGAATSMVLNVTVKDPGIPVQPSHQTNSPGTTATFTITATGTPSLLYQWKHYGTNMVDGPTGTGSTISGATTPSLSIEIVGSADTNDTYQCQVTSSAGGCATNVALSAARRLYIVYPPVFIVQPGDTVITIGDSTNLTAAVTGTMAAFPITWSWYQNSNYIGSGIPVGLSSNYYPISPATVAHRGYYYVTADNLQPGGLATSTNGLLTVNVPRPVIEPLVVTNGPNVVITWPTFDQGVYTVQYCTNLAAPVWLDLTNFTAFGEGMTTVLDYPTAGDRQRFYRILGQ